MVTPALIVDGELKCSGNVPGVDQIEAMLRPDIREGSTA
jgi:hypothetical protein